jgi:hypothetical protein
MIRFDFTVSDADAENIFSIMRDRILHNNQQIIEMIGKYGKEDYIAAYRRDNEYVEDLIKKMTNTRVEEC